MGLFSQIFGNDRPDGLFRSEMQHLTNRVDQIAKNQERIPELRDKGVGEQDRRALKALFITNTETKAKSLVSELQAVGYESNWAAPEERNDDYVIMGITGDILMSDDSIAEWTSLMCDMTAAQDCEFCIWELR